MQFNTIPNVSTSNMYINNPNLVESNIKYFLNSTLKNSYKFKENHYNKLFNIFCGLTFFIILGLILFFMYQGNTSEKLNKKKIQDKKHIIERLLQLRQQNVNTRNLENNLITNLPMY